MPESPKAIRPYWIPKPEPKESRNHVNQKYYKSATHLNIRKNKMKEVGGCCEVDMALDKLTDITGKWKAVLDHIIRIEDGGSRTDPRNHMLMKKYWHDVKTGMEKHKSILVDYILNDEGEKIPKNRMDIIKLLTER